MLADPKAPKSIAGVYSAAGDECWNAPSDFADWQAPAARGLGPPELETSHRSTEVSPMRSAGVAAA